MDKNSIQRFIAYLKGVQKVESQKDFALKIGYKSESAFSQAIKKEPIPEETLSKIKIAFPELDYWDKSVISSEDVQKYIFEKLPIEEKLNYLSNDNMFLKGRIELLEKKHEITQEINRVYLKAIMVHLSVGEDLNEEIGTLENELKKISSN